MSERLRIGEGQISGYLSISLGLISLGGVICFHFPEYFTTAEFRSLYPTEMLRWLLLLCLILAFGFALLSFLLGTSSKLAFTGVMITALAVVLGGHTVEIDEFEQSLYSISLDWLLIDIVVLSAIFVPIELFLPKRESQTKFHEEWRTDLVYFAISHLLVQLTAVIIKTPAEFIFRDWGLNDVQSVVSGWPFLIQVFVAILVADLCQYTIHRAFHRLPYLWRVHSVHHSIWAVDWIAGSRLHLVDILITRSLSYIPLYALGFSMAAFYTYVAIVSIQAVAAHANTRLPFGYLKYLLVTPQYHHWHHTEDPKFYDRNFAIHLPLVDMLFGTYYLPGDQWPDSFGLATTQFPKGYLRQLVYPFFTDPTMDVAEPSRR